MKKIVVIFLFVTLLCSCQTVEPVVVPELVYMETTTDIGPGNNLIYALRPEKSIYTDQLVKAIDELDQLKKGSEEYLIKLVEIVAIYRDYGDSFYDYSLCLENYLEELREILLTKGEKDV